MPVSYKTPGVQIVELDAFPNSVVPVETSIPVFIGYTQRADFQGVSYLNKATMISSMSDYLSYFGAQVASDDESSGTPPQIADPIDQYQPVYNLVETTVASSIDITIGGTGYAVQAVPQTVYNMYTALNLFYANGGGTAYVISIGLIPDAPEGTALAVGEPLVNPDVSLNTLIDGLTILEDDPQNPSTMIVIPDATLLNAESSGSIMQEILSNAGTSQSKIGILDIPAGYNPSPSKAEQTTAIDEWRTSIGMDYLKYGASYYPYLNTTIITSEDVNYNNLGGAELLQEIIPGGTSEPLATLFNNAANAGQEGYPSALQAQQALMNASKDYSDAMQALLYQINTLAPSAAMAGIYTKVDTEQGVWKAPANTSVAATTATTIDITNQTQADLNVDALSGKSINAIRPFTGKGVIVWGARTLDGNSLDWRYINVRRTMIMLEQSLSIASDAFVFEPNNASTWSTMKSMFNNFLTDQWKAGALAGASPEEAFSVEVGLGSTMTSQDILDGIMNISVKVAITRPAEFIVITFSQQMQTS